MEENIHQNIFKKSINTSQLKPVKMNKRLFTFLMCICISAFFWLMLNLSKQYSVTKSYPLKFINLPAKKVLIDKLPKKADFQIKTSGFKLLLLNIKAKNDSVVLNFEDSKHSKRNKKFFLLLNEKREKLASQLGSNITLLKVEPDTINFLFNLKK